MNRPSRRLVVGLLAGAVLRVLLLPEPGTSDVNIWKVWSFGAMYDVTGVYGVGGSPPARRALRWRGDAMTVDYPPLALVELALAGRIYKLWSPSFDDGRALNAMVKLPGVAAEALLIAVILTYGRRRFGDKAASWAALAFWLNPAVLLDGTVLGYLDAQMAVPACLAVGAALCGWPALASACLVIAILTKAQAVFVAPIVLAILIRTPAADRMRNLLRAAAGGSLVAAVTLLPYVIRGAWANLVQAVGRLATHDMLSANASNVWWIFTWALRVFDVWRESGAYRALTQQVRILAISRAIDLGYPNPRAVGLALVIAAIGCAVWRLRTAVTVANGFALAGFCAYAYALFAAQVHENHLYLAVPLFALAGSLDRRYRPIFWGTTAVVTLNLLLFAGLGRGLPWPVQRRWTGVDASVLLSFASAAVFALAAKVCFSRREIITA